MNANPTTRTAKTPRPALPLLLDTAFPAWLDAAWPPEFRFERWAGAAIHDQDLVRHAAENGFAGVAFFGKRIFYQSGLLELAEELGVALVAVDAADPTQAQAVLIVQSPRIRAILEDARFVVVTRSKVRPTEPALT